MASIKRGINYLLHNRLQFFDSLVRNFLRFLPDKLYISLRYRCQMGRWVNWKTPSTFSEKIQWLKIYNRKPIYTTMVDKYAVKEYVSKIIGSEYVIPTIGIWNKPEEIEWEKLPNKFVLKTTNGGGSCGVVICKDKERFNKQDAISKLNKSLKTDIYKNLREWPYKNVQKRIIAEKFIQPSNSADQGDLSDYKFFCFNGEPKYCQVIRDRHTKESIDFYDMDWNHQDFVGLNPVVRNGETPVTPVVCNGETPVTRPANFNEMISICKLLAKDILFLRVDLYEIDEKIYFGEMTFFPASGIGTFRPEVWQLKLGKLINITRF